MESGLTMSPDSISSVFPDRLIHPLPKRRLRERLSPDVADSLKYPPAQVSGTPLFYYPYNLKDDTPNPEQANALSRGQTAAADVPAASAPAAAVPATATPDTPTTPKTSRETDDDEQNNSSRAFRLVNRPARPEQSLTPTPTDNQPTAPSTASSVDGYDSFENTNNKKKRKIPTASDALHGGSYFSGDIHSTTSGSSSTNANDEGSVGSPLSSSYSGPASFVSGSPGISGPGRGRYGRNRNGRSPLRPLSETSSNWAGRYGKLKTPWPAQSGGNTGIITNAIANAEKQVSRGGQENDRALPQPQSKKSTPASAQFTFTCTSQVPGNLTWPGSDPKVPGQSHWQQGRLRGGYGQNQSSMHGGSSTREGSMRSASPTSPRGGGNGHAKPSTKKRNPRSKLSRELDEQARERQRQQREQNLANPPSGDVYICPFCEFEGIFKYKPKSLIRSFETKERKKRLEADRRQKYLEKAKARGRKGKKVSKAASSNNKGGGQVDNQTTRDNPDDGGGQGPPVGDSYDDDDDDDDEDDDSSGSDSDDDSYDPEDEIEIKRQAAAQRYLRHVSGALLPSSLTDGDLGARII